MVWGSCSQTKAAVNLISVFCSRVVHSVEFRTFFGDCVCGIRPSICNIEYGGQTTTLCTLSSLPINFSSNSYEVETVVLSVRGARPAYQGGAWV